MRKAIKPDIGAHPAPEDLLRQIRRTEASASTCFEGGPGESDAEHHSHGHHPQFPGRAGNVSEFPSPPDSRIAGARGMADASGSDQIEREMERLRRELETQLALQGVRSAARQRQPGPQNAIEPDSDQEPIQASAPEPVAPPAGQPAEPGKPKPQATQRPAISWPLRVAICTSSMLTLLMCAAILAALAYPIVRPPVEATAHDAANGGATTANKAGLSQSVPMHSGQITGPRP